MQDSYKFYDVDTASLIIDGHGPAAGPLFSTHVNWQYNGIICHDTHNLE